MEGRVRRGKGLRGLADVRQVGKAWQVKLDGDIFEFPTSATPKGVQSGKFQVSLSGRGDKWYSITPAVDDTFDVHCIGFTARDGEEPKPYQDPGGWKEVGGKRWFADPSQSCTAILEITRGKYKGQTFSLFLPYLFVEEDGMVDFEGSEAQVEKVKRFMRATGTADWEPEEFASNLLPAWQEAIQDADRAFKIVGEEGKATKILTGEVEDDADEPAPRRSRKADADVPTPRNARGRRPAAEVDEDDGDEVKPQGRRRTTVNVPKPKRGRK